MKKCVTKFCRGVVTPRNKNILCPKCSSRRWKENNPLGYAFNKLRNRARERGHEFKLTFAEYRQLAFSTGYAEGKGKTADSLSINRIRNNEGYHIGNLEIITLSENSRLRRKLEYADPRAREYMGLDY